MSNRIFKKCYQGLIFRRIHIEISILMLFHDKIHTISSKETEFMLVCTLLFQKCVSYDKFEWIGRLAYALMMSYC